MNKITIVTALLALVSFWAEAQVKVESSEFVELMSILARTAEFREYCMDTGGKYTKDTGIFFPGFQFVATILVLQMVKYLLWARICW